MQLPIVSPTDAALLAPVTKAHVMQPASVSTVPMVEIFCGIGSASHYLKHLFHPVGAFDSDAGARDVMSKRFPQCTMATDFASVMAAGDGPGTFIEAAKGARVAFASPPCSQTSVVNKARDESSYTARLYVYMLNILRYICRWRC